MKITIVDDHANDDPFYPELTARLRQDLLPEPAISWVNATQLMPSGKFDPKRILAELRKTAPDLILMDLVLYESNKRPDLILSDWLTNEIKRESSLRTVPLIYVSNFFVDHYSIPGPWRHWCFAKQALVSDEEAWNLFRQTLENPTAAAALQVKLRSLPKTISDERTPV
ncbi:MAG: hypothetical protein AABO58_25350 [Acidobacteriota bacterium]